MVSSTTTTAPLAPVLRGAPVVGSLLEAHQNLLRLYERALHEHPGIVRIPLGPPGARVVLHAVMHPDGVRDVLAARARNYGKGTQFYDEIEAYLGNGLLTSQVDTWQRQRRIIQPLFTRRRVAGYTDLMLEEARALVASWQGAAAAGADVDVHEGTMRYALHVVGRLLLGGSLDAALEVLDEAFPVLNEHIRFRGLSPVRLPRQWPVLGGRRAADAQARLYEVADHVIDAAREGDDGLVPLLLAAVDPDGGPGLSRDEVRDQVLIFLLAGHETTSNALTFTLHLLGHHPAAQQRIRSEVRATATAALESLPYTRAVLQESMRLYPPAFQVGRTALSDQEVLGHTIPAGAFVVVPIWVIHRHPEFWPDAERFDPDRFTPEREAARHRYAHLPFSGGPRACIGAQFAMLEATAAIAAVVDAFDISTPPRRPEMEAAITLRPRGAVPARLSPAP